MNHSTKLSIDYANQRSYLDDLFQVYPTIPEGIRDLDGDLWKRVEKAFAKSIVYPFSRQQYWVN